MTHKSDCAVHNEPAKPNGPCDCGATGRDPSARLHVYMALDGERDYQQEKHGNTDHRGIHSVTEYLVYIEQYLNQAKHIVTHHSDPDAKKRALCAIRKVTALGIACMEQNGIVTRQEEQEMPK
jgi:hypothetical protein